MPEAMPAAPATPNGGAPSGGSSGGSAPSGGAQSLPSGGSNGNTAGSSAPNKTPTNGSKQEPKGATFEGGSLVDRLRRAAEGEKPEKQPRIIKHKLETGDEIDVDISEHIAEALAAVRQRKLKVNGKEVDVDLEEAFEKYPLSQGAREKFEEAAQMRKRVESFETQLSDLGKRMRDVEGGGLRELLENPKMLGPEKLLAFCENIVLEALNIEKMTPEQRAALQKQREIEDGARRRKAELDQREAALKKSEAARMEAETKRWSEHWLTAIPKLLEAAGVPHTPKSDKAWREAKKEALRLGIPVTDEQIAKEVAHEYFADLEVLAQKLPPERLATLLGENAGKVGQAAADAHKAPGSQVSVKGRDAKPANGAIPAHIKTPDQYRQWQYDQRVKARAGR